ncbi:DUF2254 family protein [Streptomyces sp. NPDC058620]|uniref:DUF2254 family protein n=1 Tax=Streptomyces sp. NPDC058620 TaxID=3346560 RepID=UPI00364F1D63
MAAPPGPAPLRRRNTLRAERTQLLFALAGTGLGLLLPRITRGPQASGAQVNDMLLGLGLGVLGLTAVIFSMLFLVVQWAHTSFTPRLTMFRNSPLVWQTFAFAISLALYSLTAVLSTGTRPHVTVMVPAAAGLLLLVLLGLLRALQLRAFSAIQLAPVLHAVSERGHAVLSTLYDRGNVPATVRPSVQGPLPRPTATVTWSRPHAVLQQIDMDQLLRAARRADAVVALKMAPGTALPPGTVVADIHGDLEASAVFPCLVTGVERTFDQDPLLAFRILADIVLRALSPGVNDPATAVQGLDHLEDLLAVPAPASCELLHFADKEGTVRVMVALPGWQDFLHTGIDDVIAAALASPMTLTRLRTLLMRLHTLEHPDRHEQLEGRLAWVEAELAQRFPLLWKETRGASPTE